MLHLKTYNWNNPDGKEIRETGVQALLIVTSYFLCKWSIFLWIRITRIVSMLCMRRAGCSCASTCMCERAVRSTTQAFVRGWFNGEHRSSWPSHYQTSDTRPRTARLIGRPTANQILLGRIIDAKGLKVSATCHVQNCCLSKIHLAISFNWSTTLCSTNWRSLCCKIFPVSVALVCIPPIQMRSAGRSLRPRLVGCKQVWIWKTWLLKIRRFFKLNKQTKNDEPILRRTFETGFVQSNNLTRKSK